MPYKKGDITFTTKSESKQTPAKFILVADEEDVESAARNVLEIMLVEWGYTKPQLMISVVGGSRRFNVKENQKNVFVDGIRQLTKTTGTTWLMTSGSNVGAVTVVGEAMTRISVKVRDKVSCIGVTSWSGTDGKETIIEHRKVARPSVSARKSEDNIDISKNGDNVNRGFVMKPVERQNTGIEHFYSGYYKPPQLKKEGPVPLNPHHTHFIFVKKDDPEEEEHFRVKLWAEIQKLLTSGSLGSEDRPAAVVMIQLEGGIDTTRTVRNTLKKNTPIIICEGTGRASNYLSYACKQCDNLRDLQERYPGYFERMIDAAHPGVNAKSHQTLLENLLGNIKDVMEMKKLVEVFNMDGDLEMAGFDLAVLRALLRARGVSKEYLKLAFDWNRCDIAEEMFKQDTINLRDTDTQELVTRALLERENRVHFVALLIENGLSLDEYLTVYRLEHLYQAHANKSIIPELKEKRKTISYRSDVSPLIGKLMNSYYNPPELIDGDRFEKPYRELLMWSILANRPEITEYMWENASEPLSLGLVATRLYRSIESLAADPDEAAKCTAHADEYEHKVCSYLTTLHALDEDVTRTLLRSPYQTWGNQTALDLGAVANSKKFLSHSCCQEILEERWNGQLLHPSHLKVFAVMLLPFLLFTRRFPKFKTDMNVFRRFVEFYCAPITKFVVNWVTTFIFLVFYSYMTLYYRPEVGLADILLHVWVLTLLLEELRQVIIPRDEYESFGQRFRAWLSTFWNWMDLIALLLTLAAFLIRFNTLREPWTYDVSRNLYAIACTIFWILILRMYQSNKTLGPFLIMIREMIWALFWFLLVLIVFVIAFGIAGIAILSPDQNPSPRVLRDIFYYPYYQVTVGDWQTYTDSLYGDDTETELDTLDGYVYSVLLAAYILIGNVLLLNLLIAIFSTVYNQVESNSLTEWKYNRYYIITEFEDVPPLPAPLVVLSHVYRLVVWTTKCCRTKTKNDGEMDELLHEQSEIKKYESEAMDNYKLNVEKQQKGSREETLKKLDERLRLLVEKVKGLEEEQVMLVKKREK
ncbi:transient receptor potential cation channel subfamily M member-like 2 isoform X2 [Ptychodera flava]|uniref:transient receptor potential cation channel subfamily M member-like 2 isoform X2 n=1 Tax=Ptychodera flava TaxID=63121 RepID=UPI00396A8E0E